MDTLHYINNDSSVLELVEGGLVGRAEFGVRPVPGLLGQAVMFDHPTSGLNFGNMRNSCLGNLDLCPSGCSLRFLLKTGSHNEEEYYVSSGGFHLQSDGIGLFRIESLIYVSRLQFHGLIYIKITLVLYSVMRPNEFTVVTQIFNGHAVYCVLLCSNLFP